MPGVSYGSSHGMLFYFRTYMDQLNYQSSSFEQEFPKRLYACWIEAEGISARRCRETGAYAPTEILSLIEFLCATAA
jgi:hypothetical protein